MAQQVSLDIMLRVLDRSDCCGRRMVEVKRLLKASAVDQPGWSATIAHPQRRA